jgi:glycosyltransferase involved in cell wall biosynthesis
MQPYESSEAAARLSEIIGRPWVGDLADPWALDEMMIYPTAAHRASDLRRMRKVLRSAAAIAVSTPEAVQRLRAQLPELRGKPVVHVPNGYWAPDFEGSPAPCATSSFRIVHAGYLHTAMGYRQRRFRAVRSFLGGSLHQVDILTRSHIYLLEAIDRLLVERPDAASRIELVLAGVLSDADRSAAMGRDYVRMLGYCNHDETVRLLRTADLLFLPMHNLPPGIRATIVPGKTYEYLASGRPILAAVPDGDLRDMLASVDNAWICRPDDVPGMMDTLQALLDQSEAAQEGAHGRHTSLAAQYEYRALAHRLTQLFDTVLVTPDSRETIRASTTSLA